jgi:hypothetical protein
MQNRKKVANTSILVTTMKIKSENPTYMFIKFFLVRNHAAVLLQKTAKRGRKHCETEH